MSSLPPSTVEKIATRKQCPSVSVGGGQGVEHAPSLRDSERNLLFNSRCVESEMFSTGNPFSFFLRSAIIRKIEARFGFTFRALSTR